MVERTTEMTNGKGEKHKAKVYDGKEILVSSIIGVEEYEITIRKKGSSEELKIKGSKSIGELRDALNKICGEKAIK